MKILTSCIMPPPSWGGPLSLLILHMYMKNDKNENAMTQMLSGIVPPGSLALGGPVFFLWLIRPARKGVRTSHNRFLRYCKNIYIQYRRYYYRLQRNRYDKYLPILGHRYNNIIDIIFMISASGGIKEKPIECLVTGRISGPKFEEKLIEFLVMDPDPNFEETFQHKYLLYLCC